MAVRSSLLNSAVVAFAIILSWLLLAVSAGVEQNLIPTDFKEKQQNQCPPAGSSHISVSENVTFRILDYIILAIMLIVSCAIGTFYGFFAEKQTTGDDFLLGGSTMGTLPMSLSLAASFITAVELLGNPLEMYSYGTQYLVICLAFMIAVPITTVFYLPVYMKLRLTSMFEYLEMRFNKSVRFVAASLYVVQMCFYTSVTVYAPALALSNVTGVHRYYAVTLVYLVCIFYSSQGGMKAVIMTDSFQAAILMLSLIVIAVCGTYSKSSISEIFGLSWNSSRIEVDNMDLSLTERVTFWTQLVGGVFYWVSMFCSNQASVQKYLSVRTAGQVKIALWISALGLTVIYSINFFTGMILFYNYYQSDPLKTGAIKKEDEILPYYVMNSLGEYGIPGLFVAGIFAASLGTVASTLNSLAAVVMKDFLDKILGIRVATNREAALSKWLCVLFGIISFAIVFIVQHIDRVLKAALTFNGFVGGITLAMFSLGMFLPWASSKGTLAGSLLALLSLSWIAVGSYVAGPKEFTKFPKPNYDQSCCCFVNVPEESVDDDTFYLYKISYIWYSAIGFTITAFSAIIFSYITGFEDPCRIHPDLISPAVQRFYGKLSNKTKNKLHLPLETKEPILTLQEINLIKNGNIQLCDKK